MCVHLSWPHILFDCAVGSKRFYSFWRPTQVLLTIAFQLNIFQVQARAHADQENWLGPIPEGIVPPLFASGSDGAISPSHPHMQALQCTCFHCSRHYQGNAHQQRQHTG